MPQKAKVLALRQGLHFRETSYLGPASFWNEDFRIHQPLTAGQRLLSFLYSPFVAVCRAGIPTTVIFEATFFVTTSSKGTTVTIVLVGVYLSSTIFVSLSIFSISSCLSYSCLLIYCSIFACSIYFSLSSFHYSI